MHQLPSMRKKRIASAVLAASSLLAADIRLTTAQAQEVFLEEVVVSAQKRDENIQDVPITLNAFTSEFIEQTAARNIGDLETYTPGLEVDTTSSTQPKFALRGISTDDFGVGTDPAVGVYTDGIYMSRGGSALMFFSDVERVEILKGPQGTLFGRNAAAGAINVITRKPNEATEAMLLVRGGNYNKRMLEGMFNTALSDTVFLRLNAVTNRRDGFIENEAGGADLGTEGNDSFRASVLWAMSDETELYVSADYDDTDHDAPHAISLNPAFAPAYGDPFGDVANDADSREARIMSGISGKLTHLFTDEIELTAIVAYREFNTSNSQDDDGTALNYVYLSTNNLETNYQSYEEVRLNFDWDTVELVTGVSFSQEKAHQNNQVNTNTDTVRLIEDVRDGVADAFGNPDMPDDQLDPILDSLGLAAGSPYREEMIDIGEYEAAAVFGDAIFNITDQWSLTVGARYTEDKKKFTWLSTPNTVGFLQDVIFADGPNNVEIKEDDSWNDLSPRVVVDYKPTEDMLIYLTWATGYKAGGFNGTAINSRFDNEDVVNTELGFKTTWLESRLRVNGSIFDYLYKDRQFLQLVDSANALPIYETRNGDVRGRGIELETSWVAMESLTLSANIGLTSVKWKDYAFTQDLNNDGEFNDANEYIDLDGQPTGEPLQRLALGSDYRITTPASGAFLLHLDYSHTSPLRKNDQTRSDFEFFDRAVAGFGGHREFVNARVTWLEASGHYEASLWVKNLFDKEYVSGNVTAVNKIAESLGSPYIRRDDPRFYGVDVKYNYF
jgi:iron complex outermembrane recepter protein